MEFSYENDIGMYEDIKEDTLLDDLTSNASNLNEHPNEPTIFQNKTQINGNSNNVETHRTSENFSGNEN